MNSLKIIFFATSQCTLHKQLSEWTGRVVVNWQRYYEKQRLLGVKIEHDDFVDNDIGSSYPSTASLSEHQSSESLTTVSSDQSLQLLSNSLSEPNIQREELNEDAPIVSDIYAILEEMEMKIRSIKANYAQSSGDEVTTEGILNSLANLNTDEANGDLAETFKLMDQQVSLLRGIQQSRQQHSDFSPEPMKSLLTTLWEEDEYVDVAPSETVTTPNRDDDTAADNQSTGSNCCSSMTFSDLSSSVQAGAYSAVAPDIEAERKVEDDLVSLPLTKETLKMRKCKTERSISVDGDVSPQHRSYSAPTLRTEVEDRTERALVASIERSRSYNFIMARVRSSDSICSLLEDKTSSIYDPTEQESDNIGLPLDSSESSKQFKLKININDLPKSTRGLMTLFNIVSPSVFDGGMQVK